MKRYNPSEIEPKWQQKWAADARYKAKNTDDKAKYYVSSMFPYPSGAGMHTGHFFEHSIVDAVARFRRALGYNVMYPMGWDSFGLPAENYAIKTGKTPQETTQTNIASFKNQLTRVGASIDWSREVNTADPSYYRWTQWIFTQLLERGLAYQKEAMQWWCPKDKTVLANEQVIDGKCWRCESQVEKKAMKQWFFKITDYADALLEELPGLNWPNKIKVAQENWIGRSQGAEVQFQLAGEESRGMSHEAREEKQFVDTLKFTPGLTELILSGAKTSTIRLEPKDVIVGDRVQFLTRDGEKVTPFGYAKITQIRTMALADIPNDLEGHGLFETDQAKLASYQDYYGKEINFDTEFTVYDFAFDHDSCLVTRDSIRVFTTRPDTLFGATFLVLAPEHPLAKSLVNDDTKDAAMAYIDQAVKKSEIERQSEGKDKTGVFTGSYAINPATGEKVPIWIADYVLGGYGTGAIMAVPAHDERDFEFAEKFKLPIVEVVTKPTDSAEQCYHGEGLLVNSGQFDGMSSAEAREEIVAWLEQQGLGKTKVSYKMRDWLISRQRYWGAPIPIIHCAECGAVPVPKEDLPVILPNVEDFAPRGDGRSVLAAQEDWVNVACPACGGEGRRETDTMDGYACSSWYLLRYTDPQNANQAWDPTVANYWAPLDMYIGGDHAVAHLLYVRFWTHVFKDMGLTDFKEPVRQLVYHGLIQAEDGRKMSKSLGNVVDPLEVIDQGYGADSLRTFELFLGPINENSAWSSRGITGVYRFISRVWTLAQEYIEYTSHVLLATSQEGEMPEGRRSELDSDHAAKDKQLASMTHATIKKVTDDMNRLSFNTAIAALMEYTNELYKLKTTGFTPDWQFAMDSLVKLMQPFAPHVAAELWEQLGNTSQLDFADWPQWDDAKIVTDLMTIVVQVNGRVRAKIDLPSGSDKSAVEAAALGSENVTRHLGGKKPAKVIYIPGRLLNIVV